MKLEGSVYKIFEEQKISDNFSKRDLILLTHENYPQHIKIQFVNSNIYKLDKLSLKDHVEVSINIRGREWESPQKELKYFVTLEGWRIDKINTTLQPEDGIQPPTPDLEKYDLPTNQDDLPF